MKTDIQLQRDIVDGLQWEPSIESNEIGVSVTNGAVTLSGTVQTFAEKVAAKKAVQRIHGVRAVADEVQIKPIGVHARTDTEIAESIANSLKHHVWVPSTVKAAVDRGWVTLTGEVAWAYQLSSAFNAVRYLSGVKGVANNITLKPDVQPSLVKDAIEKALKRSAEIDAKGIQITTNQGQVTLSGTVHSWQERREAAEAAWKAPGVQSVENNLDVVLA